MHKNIRREIQASSSAVYHIRRRGKGSNVRNMINIPQYIIYLKNIATGKKLKLCDFVGITHTKSWMTIFIFTL